MIATIVIPVYKRQLDALERASLSQCLNVFSNYDIYLIMPNSLDHDEYSSFFENNLNLKIKRFHDDYFKGIEGYNRLCLSVDFYNSFANYQYMLIYQLDTWVFYDKLEFWCSKGFDYIGAPWPHHDNLVGNGGFSLRKIKSFISILSTNGRLWTLSQLIHKNDCKRLKGILLTIIQSIGYRNSINSLIDSGSPEDEIFCIDLKGSRRELRIPNYIEASMFALECNPKDYFFNNRCSLPMGCHQPFKIAPDFWKQYIKGDLFVE